MLENSSFFVQKNWFDNVKSTVITEVHQPDRPLARDSAEWRYHKFLRSLHRAQVRPEHYTLGRFADESLEFRSHFEAL